VRAAAAGTWTGPELWRREHGAVLPQGLDAGTGGTAWYQFLYRDPANGAGLLGTALSNAVELSFL